MSSDTWSDLSVEVFLALRQRFFDTGAIPKPYPLRGKRNTQDDPLDEYICQVLEADLRSNVKVEVSGPLVTPDLVVHRPTACNQASRAELRTSPERVVGLEVKKLERGASGRIARASGLDYNTTPPCGTVRVYDLDGAALDIKGCYLFVCQESVPEAPQTYRLSALALCDGNLLNEDFDYYLSIVGPRSKEIGVGTYGDGANRVRPMLIFSNPLSARFLDHQATLIHVRADLEAEYPSLLRVGTIERSIPSKDSVGRSVPHTIAEYNSSGENHLQARIFHCYRARHDMAVDPGGTFHERNPFPTPQRSERTTSRGRFVISVRPGR